MNTIITEKVNEGYTRLNYWNGIPGRTIFILISGKAGTGKTTFGELLAQHLTTYTSLTVQTANFADTVKSTARVSFGWDGKKDDRGRRLLQQIGGIGREYNESIWARNLVTYVEQNNLFPPDVVIAGDWRFPNELAYLEKEGFQTLLINMSAPEREILKDTEYYKDISETALDDFDRYDYVIQNDDLTYEELKSKALEIVRANFPILKETK